MCYQLAIVIPYYKNEFFKRALQSIKNQSEQQFHVYIGDDCSPNDPKAIFAELNSDGWFDQKVSYKRFEINLGGISLVKHWERCIKLLGDETWIWLFSDDDIMEADCVKRFYEALNETRGIYDLFKLRTIIIDENELLLSKPEIEETYLLNSFDFITQRLRGELNSFVVEYIFSRKIYEQTGGFYELPLAWGSDDITWIKFSQVNGIYIISGPKVFWRLSKRNISGDTSKNGVKKIEALLKYCRWLTAFFRKRDDIKTFKLDVQNFFFRQLDIYLNYISPLLFLRILILGRGFGLTWRRITVYSYYKNKNFILGRKILISI